LFTKSEYFTKKCERMIYCIFEKLQRIKKSNIFAPKTKKH
jgi:hypothetical protein